MPPMANPVEARTASASGRVRASPITPAAAFSFTRLRPETKSRYGAPLALPAKTSDLTICPTSQRHGADRDRKAEPLGGVADLERARRQSRRGLDDAGHWLSSVTLRQPTVPS